MAATVETSRQFIDLVRESQLVDAERLDAYVKFLGDLDVADARMIADRLVADKQITHFQADQLLKGRSKGFILSNKYKVMQLLGVGGMGKVFLCQHMLLKRLVAIKLLSPSQAKDPSTLQRFMREARAVAALDDPNIVRIFDVEEDKLSPLMVMEFVDGTSLQEVVGESGPLPLEHAVHYIAQAALGLQHANQIGIIHRDIKPGNLLLDRQGVVKIADMGLAKFRQKGKDSSITERYDSNHVLGTADYLAPEQAIDSSKVDIRVDIYGLGATFYFLLAGEPPFPEPTVAEKLLAHQQRPVPSVRRSRPEIPKEIDDIIVKMMEKRAKDRYQTPLEVIDALAPWTQTTPEAPDFTWFRRHPSAIGDASIDPNASTEEQAIAPSTIRRSEATSRVKLVTEQRAVRGKAKSAVWIVAGVAAFLGVSLGIAKLIAPVVNKTVEPVPKGDGDRKDPEKIVEPPKVDVAVMKAPDAGKHVNETVTVEFEVKSTGFSRDNNTLFLNSTAKKGEGQFTTLLYRDSSSTIFPGLAFEDLPAYFKGRTVRVRGTVSEYMGSPQIKVTAPDQLTMPM